VKQFVIEMQKRMISLKWEEISIEKLLKLNGENKIKITYNNLTEIETIWCMHVNCISCKHYDSYMKHCKINMFNNIEDLIEIDYQKIEIWR